jgi:serine/threonine protein phosphatase PrpC
VLATDGVTEFLTSHAVVELVAQFLDPFQAASVLVAEAYRLWMVYESPYVITARHVAHGRHPTPSSYS